jgi:hypothetical protein
MRVLFWIKVILAGVVCSVILSALSLTIDEIVRPDREILLLNLKYLVYIIVLTIAAGSGAIIGAAILATRSFKISMAVAVAVALTISIGLVKGAVETYQRSDHFDSEMFYADLVQIALNLAIYPAVCFTVWKLFRKELAPGH